MFHAKLVYDKKAVCQSSVVEDFDRIVNLDQNGVEHISYEKVDYPKIQESLGDFTKWSLKSLVSAGIDPDFGIRTGFGTRLEAASAIQAASARIIDVVEQENKSE